MAQRCLALLCFTNLVLLLLISRHHARTLVPPTPTSTITSLSKHSNVTDFQALISIKSVIDPRGSLASWNDSIHFCRWLGVTCGGRQHPQRVVALNLSSLDLVGFISPAITNLTFLKTIDISGNQIHGSIPEEIGRLFRLRYLNLTTNSLEGGIPSSLSHCSKLEVLHLKNIIGSGSFGTVYKGILDENSEKVVAVKVLNLQTRGASKSFMAECEAMRNIRHRNLVKIITVCSSADFRGNDFKAVVFEFMSNGSLDDWLHSKGSEQLRPKKLNLMQRLNISIDVASALDYLHHQGDTPIVHCDLKPTNILLDDDMTAHVGDFGLARFLNKIVSKSSQCSTSSAGLKGSIGYIAPEYGVANKVSTRGDVYSFGILLLEMFTAKRPTDDAFTGGLSLRKFVVMAFPERIMDVVDTHLLTDEDDEATDDAGNKTGARGIDCIASTLRIGISCSNELPTERMEMKDVIRELHNVRDVFMKKGSSDREGEMQS